jgi:hypothetical protein
MSTQLDGQRGPSVWIADNQMSASNRSWLDSFVERVSTNQVIHVHYSEPTNGLH